MNDLLTLPAARHELCKWDGWALAVLICLNCFWLATLALPFFTADDPYFVTDNRYVAGGLSVKGLVWAITTTFPDYSHPLTWISLQIDTSLFGREAWGYHLTNALIHGANVLLLYALLRAIFGRVGRSVVAAAIFSIHPQRVESVAWISERKDVLAVFFGLLAFLAYVRFVRRGGAGSYLTIFLLFFASILAKPLLVMFPILLLVLDWWPLDRVRRGTAWRVLGEKLPLAGLALGGALSTYLTVLGTGKIRGTAMASAKQAVMNYVLYLRDTFYFGRMCFFSKPLVNISVWELAGAGLILGAVTVGVFVWAWRGSKRGKAALAGWLWFVISLLPMSGISQAGYSMRGDRFMYVPAIGLIFGMVFGVVPAMETAWRKRVGAVAGLAVVTVLLIFSAQRLSLWRDPLLLFEHDLKLDPGNAYLEIYAAYAARGEHPDAAAEHLRRAKSLDPTDFRHQGWDGTGVTVK